MMKKSPALAEIYRDHLDDVFHWFRRIGIPEHDLPDVAHKLFLELHGALPSYDPERPIKPWLKAIAVRTGCHHLALSHRHRETLVDEITAPDEAPTSEERLGEEQRARAVREVLASVDEVLALHDLDGLAIEEISKQLGVPAPTLYTRRRRAIEQFKVTWLRRHGHGARGVVVPLGLGLSSHAGATALGVDPPQIPAGLGARLWKRLTDALRVGPSSPLGESTPPPLRLIGAFVQSRAVEGLLLFALGTGSGVAAYASLFATHPSRGALDAGLPSTPGLVEAREASSGAPALADPADGRTGSDAAAAGSAAPAPSAGRTAPADGEGMRLTNKPPARASGVVAAPPPPTSELAAPPPSSSAGTNDPALAREMQLIQAAKSAELRGDFAAALGNLEQHQREFPQGNMAQGRELLVRRIRARVGTTP